MNQEGHQPEEQHHAPQVDLQQVLLQLAQQANANQATTNHLIQQMQADRAQSDQRFLALQQQFANINLNRVPGVVKPSSPQTLNSQSGLALPTDSKQEAPLKKPTSIDGKLSPPKTDSPPNSKTLFPDSQQPSEAIKPKSEQQWEANKEWD